ncbi:MAG: ATP-binding protein [Oscillospiraceae bacterium]|nr:ATP-binding protein [Oscillospiraceae bacterium]MCL2279756.1 ATP-binding protein [Oscillospiraceae bacterium]
MKRKISAKLLAWKNKTSGRMPLLIYGARQVGKTYIINEFGKEHYESVAYFNLETNNTVSSYFSENIEPERILMFLETQAQMQIIPGETLIIFDEIQTCERALTSLKYFNELAPEYHIIGAGSLLGVAINREKFSFPVGNVDSITLYPLDFEEFLWALGEDRLCCDIRSSFELSEALPHGLHEKALEYYRQYLITGGMPMAIRTFCETGSFLTVPDVQSKIINDYISDMAKYASNSESVKIRAAFDSIPVQLAKDNKKFQYKLAMKGGTANLFGTAIDWLLFAGTVLKCERISQGTMPLSAYRDLSGFKLYMGDVGLLMLKSGISQQSILSAGIAETPFLGAVAENYVAQSLVCNGYSIFYWTSEGIAELDFVIQKDNDIIGIEVKSGTRTKSKSLNLFVTKYKPTYCIRISSKNFGFENNIKAVPLYAVFCL